eukprot:14749980-Alexandrium_andersonii.AAC.1
MARTVSPVRAPPMSSGLACWKLVTAPKPQGAKWRRVIPWPAGERPWRVRPSGTGALTGWAGPRESLA